MSFLKIKLFTWRICQFVIFWWNSKSKWRIHSPFVYELVTKVFPHKDSSIGQKIEKVRLEYITNHQLIEIHDFGAGFDNQKKEIVYKTISEITKSSARKQKEGELIYRIINKLKPKIFLELGTNLGFSSAYIASALKEIHHNDYQLISVEGSESLYNYSKSLLQKFQLDADLVNMPFDDFLRNLKMNFDGIFIDGNHTYEATLRYFHTLKNHLNGGGFIIFDDIYWNQSMKNAWNEITNDDYVTLSLDLYDFGIVFIKKNQAKEHFKIWY